MKDKKQLSQLYECRVVRKAIVSVDRSHVLLNVMSFFHLVEDFEYLYLIQ